MVKHTHGGETDVAVVVVAVLLCSAAAPHQCQPAEAVGSQRDTTGELCGARTLKHGIACDVVFVPCFLVFVSGKREECAGYSPRELTTVWPQTPGVDAAHQNIPEGNIYARLWERDKHSVRRLPQWKAGARRHRLEWHVTQAGQLCKRHPTGKSA